MSGSPGNPLTIPVNQCLSCNVVMETTKREISNAVRQKTGRDRQLEKSQESEDFAERNCTVGVIKHVGVKQTVRPPMQKTQYERRLSWIHICSAAPTAKGWSDGEAEPSPMVWFADWVMAVSRAICTGAKAPVTFARGRAAIKETGGRIALQTRCQEQQRSSPPPARPDHRQEAPRMEGGRGGGREGSPQLPVPARTQQARCLGWFCL